MTETVDYAVFYDQLTELVATQDTGTLYFRNDANHVAVVGVRTGTIVSLICGPKRGRSAVELIRQSRNGTLRLDLGAVVFHEHELPSTPEILDLLSPLRAARQASPDHATGAEAVPAGVAGQAQILCSLLTEFIGPVAPLVCEEKMVSGNGVAGPGQMDDVIHALAREIENTQEAEEFVRRARQALQTGEGPKGSATVAPEPIGVSAIDILELKRRLCDVLTGYLGPVAPLVCEENISVLEEGATREQLEHAIRHIAAEIGDEEEAAAFITEAWELVTAVSQ